MGSTVLELEEAVDSCRVEDVLVLELEEDLDSCCVEDVLMLKPGLFAPAGEPALPFNWASRTKEARATTIKRTTAVELFFVRLVIERPSSYFDLFLRRRST